MKKSDFFNIQFYLVALTNNKENVDNKQMMISTVIAPCPWKFQGLHF